MIVTDINRLRSVLLTSGLQQKDNALYQVINGLIDSIGQINSNISILDETSGTSGDTGATGSPGFGLEDLVSDNDLLSIPGPTGVKGDTGTTGPQGPIGFAIDGIDGSDSLIPGPQGNTGATGATGATGNIGPIGQTGDNGLDADLFPIPGPVGPTGAKGDTGDKGDTGNLGPMGFPGNDGDDGDLIAIPGPQGPTGNPGTNGITGPMGPPGMDSDSGGSDDSIIVPPGNLRSIKSADGSINITNSNFIPDLSLNTANLALLNAANAFTNTGTNSFAGDVKTVDSHTFYSQKAGSVTKINSLGKDTPFSCAAGQTFTWDMADSNFYVFLLFEYTIGYGAFCIASYAGSAIIISGDSRVVNSSTPAATETGVFKSATSSIISVKAGSSETNAYGILILGTYATATTNPA